MIRMALFALITAGCLSTSSHTCPGDLVCPEAKLCREVQGHSLCVGQDQIDACVEQPEGAACMFADQRGGCVEGTCLATSCGNSVREAGEACDDGNTVTGDGCSVECQSDETCGNGLVDPVRIVDGRATANEQCDDGNRIAHDACSSACRVEAPAWLQLFQQAPIPRYAPALAYDVDRGRVALFGGRSTTSTLILDELWAWDGTTWAMRRQLVRPPGRSDHAMAYSVAEHQLVIYGGQAGSTQLDDTWAWDGTLWRFIDAEGPGARKAHGMVYDAAREVIVMFGGTTTPNATLAFGGSGPVEHGDTWELANGAWREVCASGQCGPDPRSAAALGYDPKRRVVVLFGGLSTSNQTFYNDVWEFDGVEWTNKTPPVPGPSERMSATLTFDPVSETMVLAGGISQGPYLDMWTWDGTEWREVMSAQLPTGFEQHAAAADPVRRRIVAYTSQTNVAEWDGVAWTMRTPEVAPPAGSGPVAVDDGSGGRSILVVQGRTFEHDGTRWRELVGPQPQSRTGHAMAHDLAGRRTLLFGGGTPAALGDTWALDSATNQWTSLATTTPRRDHAMAWDGERVIAFGGYTAAGPSADTLAWTGSAWMPLAPTTSPPARAMHAMAYDPIRDRVVLFGGRASRLLPSETWEWDGTTWAKVMVAQSPPAREGATLTWDPARRRIVLLGGSGVTLFNDAWEYDGATWSPIVTLERPTARAWHAAFMLDHGVGVFGGNTGPNLFANDTWQFRWESFVREEVCHSDLDLDGDALAGCADGDCWRTCTPACPPGSPATCADTTAHCGDAQCDPFETCRTCPADCGPCAATCGDFACTASEECPGDC